MSDNEVNGPSPDEAMDRLLGDLLPAILAQTTSTDHATGAALQILLDQAARGSRSAKDALRFPWGTSEAPKSAMARVRLQRDGARKDVLKHIVPLLSAVFKVAEANQIERDCQPPAHAIGDAPGERLLRMLGEHGVSDRTLQRMSSGTVALLAELLNDKAAQGPILDTSLETLLKQHHLIDLVCATASGDWRPDLHELWDEDLRRDRREQWACFGDPYCHLPRQVTLDTARRPRGHDGWERKAMFDFMWDAVGPSRLFRVFVRATDLEFEEREAAPTNYLPPFETVEQMLALDEEFARIFEINENYWKELDAHRTLGEVSRSLLELTYDGTDVEENGAQVLTYSSPDSFIQNISAKDHFEMGVVAVDTANNRYFITQHIINFSAAQILVINDDRYWADWKAWGILLLTIDEYLGSSNDKDKGPWENHRNLAWLYLLKGRSCNTDAALPPSFRELLFDWLELPVYVSEKSCTRYLVPIDALTGELGNDDKTQRRRRAWARDKRLP